MPGGGDGPIANEVAFGGSWAVAMWAEVEANPFDAIEKEVAFLGVEG